MKRRSGICARVPALLICAAFAACAPVPPKPAASKPLGNVDAQELKAPDGERYDHAGHVDYIQPFAYPENVAPVYPADLLVRRLPATAVMVRLIVDANGAVADVQPLDTTRTPEQDRFLTAVSEACARWKFSPLIRLDLDAGPTTVVDDEGSVVYSGRPTALPFHRDYTFNFSQREGKPRVDTADEKSAR